MEIKFYKNCANKRGVLTSTILYRIFHDNQHEFYKITAAWGVLFTTYSSNALTATSNLRTKTHGKPKGVGLLLGNENKSLWSENKYYGGTKFV